MANYHVTETGEVWNTNTGKKLKPFKHPQGYLMVAIFSNGKRTTKYIHILVAEAYIPNLQNKPEVNHKDGNKTNNYIGNLEWCTKQENMTHASMAGLRTSQGKVFWMSYDKKWRAEIVFKKKKYTKTNKSSKEVCEQWLEQKREEFYGN